MAVSHKFPTSLKGKERKHKFVKPKKKKKVDSLKQHFYTSGYKRSYSERQESEGGPSRGYKRKFLSGFTEPPEGYDTSWRTPQRRKADHDHFAAGGRFPEATAGSSTTTPGSSNSNSMVTTLTQSQRRYYKKIGKSKRRRFSKRANRSGRKSTKRIVQIAKSVSLSLCEPKQFKAIDKYQVLGNNIPHFYTGGLNLGYLTNERTIWNGTGANYGNGHGIQKPLWVALTSQGFETNTGIAQDLKFVGRTAPVSMPIAGTTIFENANNGKYLDIREGSEIVANKLVYKITFNTSQAYSMRGTNAKYHCVLFRYKTENLMPRTALNQAEVARVNNPVAKANIDPLDHVGWNPYLKANMCFKGQQGEGSTWDGPASPGSSTYKGGNPIVGDTDVIQLGLNGSWSNDNLKAVQHKSFTFRNAFAYGSASSAEFGSPTQQHTVYLSHDFKNRKIKYGLRRDTVATSTTAASMLDAIAPDGHNYGVAIYASAIKEFIPCVPGVSGNSMGYPENTTWTNLAVTAAGTDDQCLDGESDCLASYEISKAFYYKDP